MITHLSTKICPPQTSVSFRQLIAKTILKHSPASPNSSASPIDIQNQSQIFCNSILNLLYLPNKFVYFVLYYSTVKRSRACSETKIKIKNKILYAMALDLLHEVERQNKIVDRKEKCYIDMKNVM